MRWLGVALMATSGCMGTVDEPPVPVHGSTPGHSCDASSTRSLVGRPASSDLGASALKLAGARAVRWIRPGDAVTMDYRYDRLNIELDETNRVRALRCG